MNKYERIPDLILDLHGLTVREAEREVREVMKSRRYAHVRIITGKGAFRETGPVLRNFLSDFLLANHIHYTPAKQKDGGEGAFEVFFVKS